MRRRTTCIENLKTAFLEEADEMLNIVFSDNISDILKGIPEERQTRLFSATMPKEIRDIASTLMKTPKEVKVKAKEMTGENIEQFVVKDTEKIKLDTIKNKR